MGGLTITGDSGFLRATVLVERPQATNPADRSTIYDTLFPVGPKIHLQASLLPSPHSGSPTARVCLKVDSVGAVSESFVEPTLAHGEPTSPVHWTPTALVGQTLAEGREVEVGSWAVGTAANPVRVVIRTLLSRGPTGPRLKPGGKPPV